MNIEKNVVNDLKEYIHPIKTTLYPKFFKTGKGEYAEGDLFLGVTVPNIKIIAKKYQDLNLEEIKVLLNNKYHEIKLFAIFILVNKYQKNNKNKEIQKEIFEFYIKNTKLINNWDLVDSSAYKIVGHYLLENSQKNIKLTKTNKNLIKNHNKNNEILFKLAKSNNLWERRIAIVSTFYFIKNNQLKYTIKISKILINDKEDLIHKATGWMLRELGKKDEKRLEQFLKENINNIPRTCLRYSIEKFTQEKIKYYLNLK